MIIQTPSRIIESLVLAKSGNREGLETLLGLYRSYLLGIAAVRLDGRLRARCSPSDVVQETLLEAFRDFEQFQGDSEKEFLAWIRQILTNNLVSMVETHLVTKKRDTRRERSLEDQIPLEASRLEQRDHWLTDNHSSPSSIFQKKEQLSMVVERMGKLPSHYRDVLILRHIEEKSFEEVAQRLGRTSGAVRMIWLRALEQLRRMMPE